MFSLLNLAATVTPTPGEEGSLRPGLDPAQVTPGLLGFLATLFLVVAVIFLIRDMVKRIRRVRYKAMAEEEAQAQRERPADGPAAEAGLPVSHPEDPDGKPQRHAPGGKYGPDAP
ncbi:flagellar biosynthesis/type III secretory pathway M-ring protein FliF/YscJ [Arthrobacter pigmenti]|uniref:Flagellar biosynthesis/type III secretory pathway M-ring protein FliF/YscJ n=1 Tax=Arthrobacter pigmenti TaxID=271432 RepID=A0A846RNL4_9MICC|nr:flagellar biosynthesis/type III secretory pathway M-ring protein FliF/YscJ [Arthrobacter pigmenti]